MLSSELFKKIRKVPNRLLILVVSFTFSNVIYNFK